MRLKRFICLASMLVACGPDTKAPSVAIQFFASSETNPLPEAYGSDDFDQPDTAPAGIGALHCHGVIEEAESSTVVWSIALRNETADELIILLDSDAADVNSNRVSIDVLYQPESEESDGIIDTIFPGDELSCTIEAEDGSNPVVSETLILVVSD